MESDLDGEPRWGLWHWRVIESTRGAEVLGGSFLQLLSLVFELVYCKFMLSSRISIDLLVVAIRLLFVIHGQ